MLISEYFNVNRFEAFKDAEEDADSLISPHEDELADPDEPEDPLATSVYFDCPERL